MNLTNRIVDAAKDNLGDFLAGFATGLDPDADEDYVRENTALVLAEIIAPDIAEAVHPRIETAEQLDALPVRAVLKEEFKTGNGAIWERWHGDTWVRLDSAPHIPGRTPFLPAIVLYTPGDAE